MWIVIGEDSNLYSVVDKSGAAKIIKYQYNNGKFDYDTVAEESKKVLYPREDNSFSVNGEDCTRGFYSAVYMKHMRIKVFLINFNSVVRQQFAQRQYSSP